MCYIPVFQIKHKKFKGLNSTLAAINTRIIIFFLLNRTKGFSQPSSTEESHSEHDQACSGQSHC